MATAERDLTSQAESFLEKLLGERVSESDKHSLGDWLSSKLESERQGWKRKLQMSMKEIERERRMALEVHSAIHQMNSLLENVGGAVELFREPSMYRGSDKDLKTSHIDQLQKNIDAVRSMNRYFEKERVQCFEVLGEEDTEQNLVPVLRGKIEHLQDTVGNLEKELTEAKTKVEKLSETLDSERAMYKEASRNRTQEIKQLRTIVEDFKDRSLGEPREQKRTRVDTPVQVYLRLPTRDCCIQTDLRSREISKSRPTSATGLQQEEKGTSSKMPTPVTEVRISKSQPKKRDVMQISNVGNVDLESLSARDARSPPSSGTLSKQVEKRISRQSADFDAKNSDHRQTVDYLRGQMMNFAHQLEQTREQMEFYRKEIAFMKACKQRPEKDKGSHGAPPANSWLQAGSMRSWSSEGYLSGTKVAGKEAEVVFMHSKAKRSQESSNKMAANGAASSDMATSRCLRCQKLYRLRNNHQGACTYHIKDRRRVERYDSSGKLLKMSMIWECCKANAESPGCAVGQHV